MGRLFSLERRSTSSWVGEPPVSPVYVPGNQWGANGSGNGGTAAALAVPAVWACVGLLSNAVSMLPLDAYQLDQTGIPSKVPNPPQILTSPSGDMTQSEWLHMVMVSLLLRGNCIGVVVARDNLGRPTQIDLQNPDNVRIDVDPNTGAISYRVGTKSTPVDNDDIWHVRGMTMPGAKIGTSPIDTMAATLGLDLSARQFALDFFAGGGIPKATLESDQAINQTQARTIKERLMAATSRREPLILGAGLKYSKISVNPEESQFLGLQQATVTQVARYFHVPAGMIGGTEGGSMTYSNVEQRSLDFLTYAVSFWLKRIEDAMFGLLPNPQYVRFDTDALLRTDAETQAKVDVQLIAAKVLVPSEVRARRDMPPMTAAQKKEADMVPLTVTPLGGAKALPALKELPGPNAPVPADDSQGDPANG